MRIGLVGLPNSGKTTVFNALTKGDIQTASYSSGTLDVNTLVVDVPDPRLDKLTELYKAKRTVYAKVEYSDIGGMRDDAERGVSITGEQLGLIGTNDALIHVVRAFEDGNVPHPLKSVDPLRDIELLESEFLVSDLSKVENRMIKLEANLKKGKVLPNYEEEKALMEILTRVKDALEENIPIRSISLTEDERKELRGFQFLSEKPLKILINLGDENEFDLSQIELSGEQYAVSSIRGRLEMDIVNLEGEDQTLFMEEYGITDLSLNRIISESYQLLDRMIFFTAGEQETRAWEAPANAPAVTCAGVIHSDLERGFIKADVVHYTDLIELGSEKEAKAAGKYRQEGRDYIVKEGDVLVIRFNVSK